MPGTKIPREAYDLPLAVQAQLGALGRIAGVGDDDLREIAAALAEILRPRPVQPPRHLS